VTANNESWYINREPLQFAGDLYYPAGAGVFFDGNTMVRSGHYNGVPLYTDTTLEPYSVVYVPLERGVMQPYERLRQGSLAGTTASRAPSFPVSATASSTPLPGASAHTAAADWCHQRVAGGATRTSARQHLRQSGRAVCGAHPRKAEWDDDSHDRATYQQRWDLDPVPRREMDQRRAGGSGDT
jgi:hypothetical protein